MASRYWVGGIATWDATAGTKWATTSGGAGGAAVPTSADDVFFDTLSGVGTVTLSASSVCKSFDATGFAGTLSHPAAVTWTVGNFSGTAVHLKLSATMTYTPGSSTTSLISLQTTSSSDGAITTAGKTLAAVSSDGTGGKFVLQDALSMSGPLTLTGGTLDTNGMSVTALSFTSSNSNVRTLTMGASSVTLTTSGGGSAWAIATSTNLTITANTSTLTLSGGSAGFQSSATVPVNGMSLVLSGSAIATISSAQTFVNLTRTGTASKTDVLSLSAAITVTGTFTVNGNSATNRMLVQSSTIGTQRVITAAAVSITNADFIDISGAGAASWNLAAITGLSGDAGGNSGITFTTPQAQFRIGAGGNWSDATKWSQSTGGSNNGRVPLPQDDVTVDGGASGTVTLDMPRSSRSFNCTGFTGTVSFSAATAFYGDFILSSGMTFTGSSGVVFGGRGSYTWTMAGKTPSSTFTVSAPGGTYTSSDALSSSTISVTAGTWVTGGNSVTTSGTLASTGTTTRAITLGASTVTLTATAATTILNLTATGLTFSAASSNIVISTASANARNFTMTGSLTFGTITYTVADSPGALTVTGSGGSTVGTLSVAAGRRVTFPSSVTTTVTTPSITGEARDYVYLPGVSGSYISTPNAAANQITGDITIDAKVLAPSWAPAAIAVFVTKSGSSTTRSFSFGVDTTGKLALFYSLNGSTALTALSSVVSGFTNGTTQWIRVTRIASTGVVKFYTSTDGATWTQLGSNVAGTSGNLSNQAVPLELGTGFVGTSFLSALRVYNAKIYNSDLGSSTGTPVQAFDANAHVTGTDTWTNPTTTEVWTLNSLAAQGDGRITIDSSTSGTAATLSKATGTVSLDYLSIKDSTATGGATWYAGANSVSVSNNTGWLFSAPPSGRIKVNSVVKLFKVYTGGAWNTKPVKRYSAGAWS